MKSICFESYRESKRDRMRRPKPQTLDPSWYTDNIYSNQSIDLDEDYIPECLRYNNGNVRNNPSNMKNSYKLRDIDENDDDGNYGRGEFFIQRSKSCKDFKYPKSRSCCFGGYELKPKPTVPKSYSFSVNRTKTKPFDVIDYEPPPSRRDRKVHRKSGEFFRHDSSRTRCCARDRCTSSKCFFEEIYNYNNRKSSRDRRPYSGGTSRRNVLYVDPGCGGIACPDDRSSSSRVKPRFPNHCDEYCYRKQNASRRKIYNNPEYVIEDHRLVYDDDNLCESGDHYHPDDMYDTDLDRYIRDERSKLMMQDKFLDEDDIYLRTDYHPIRNKTMLEVKPPSKYDDDTASDSTEMDLEDFNFDFEKYWEKLDKPPSPIDIDIQQKNMNTNMKVKNVNVGRYNNGTPIDDHQREQERAMIKKNLLEGMPSPPQNNSDDYHFFDHTISPFHRYSHKVYPETIPTYKYNNFYPHDNLHSNQGHHNSSAISLINNIFSIYKPNKYSPLNCQQLSGHKPEPCKKMNVPSTIRPLGAPHNEYMTSMKRPLIVSTEQPHFKIIPEKTGLKISPLYSYDMNDKKKHKLKSTARPLLFPH